MTIGILCAMPEEFEALAALASGVSTDADDRFAGTIGASDVIVARCGLGKVSAAMTATMLIEGRECRALVSAGTAGSLNDIEPLSVVIASSLVQHDYGRSRDSGEPELYRPGLPPLPAYREIDHVLRVPEERLQRQRTLTHSLGFVKFGPYASGDLFINDDATRMRLVRLGAIAVDMESGAIAQVAEHFGIPWLVAKGISDSASGMSHEDFLAGLAAASRRAAEVVAALLPSLH